MLQFMEDLRPLLISYHEITCTQTVVVMEEVHIRVAPMQLMPKS